GGSASRPLFGTLVPVFVLCAVLFVVFAGLPQSEPKSILAYSSISQMGLMTIALGVGLAFPEAWPAALLAILVYATHHALAKGALFLGVGVSDDAASRGRLARLFALAGLGLAALVVAGAPLTSGAFAKEFLKEASYSAAAPWNTLLEPLIQLGAVGTTLLMMRFLQRVWRAQTRQPGGSGRPAPGLALPWVFLLGGMFAILAFLDPPPSGLAYALLSFSAVWPVVAGIVIFLVAVSLLGKRAGLFYPRVPEGDLLVPVAAAIAGSYSAAESAARSVRSRLSGPVIVARHGLGALFGRLGALTVLTEVWLRRWTISGGLVLALTVAMFFFAALLR
ncbi:MAG: proton-conducting transporter membrane subunit, partial [Rubrobacter sp.]